VSQEIISCKLVDAAFIARKEAIRTTLLAHVQEVKELEDGYAFGFSDGSITGAQLLEFIESERECCPFFTFELIFEPHDGPRWLRLRGSAEIKTFIAAEFGDLIAASAVRS
jgi:hypothetical protein